MSPISAGVVKDLVNTVVLAATNLPFTAAALCIIRLEQDGDADDGKYWDTTNAWVVLGSLTAPASAHGEAGQHLYQLPAAATTGRSGARITFTFVDTQTEASVTTLCGTKEYLIGDIAIDVDALLTTSHGLGSWQQSIAFGAALHQVANSNSLVTVGTVASGTFASTALLDGIYWRIQDDGGELDMYFEFLISADGVPTAISHIGRIQGSGDDLDVFAFNWGSTWEHISVLVGANPPNDLVETFALFPQHVGTGANLSKVRVRFYQPSGLVSANFYSDQVVLSYIVLNRSVGYADGGIWVDTNNGSPGAVQFINGVADNPVDNWADALTLSAILGMRRFHIAGGSSITLTASSDNYQIIGNEYVLDLNGKSIAGAFIEGANITGTSAGLNARLVDCLLGTVSLTQCTLVRCGVSTIITLLTAGTYLFEGCWSAVAGVSTPTLDFGAALGDTNLNLRHWSGGWEILNMGRLGTDKMSLEGDGQLIVNANCVGGTIAIRGAFTRTDNASGAVTFSEDARIDMQQIRDAMKLAPVAGAPAAGSVDVHLDDILADTDAIDGRLPAYPADESLQQAAHTQTQADVAAVQADTDDIQARLPAALVGGRMNSDVGNMQVGVIDAAAIATNAIDADAIAADAIGSSEMAASAVTEIQSAILSDAIPFQGADIAAILSDTDAIDARLPSDPADESLQQAAHAQTQADIAAVQVDTALLVVRLTAARAAALDLLSGISTDSKIVEQILRNKLVLSEGVGDNWELWDDTNSFVILRWPVRDKNLQAIALSVGEPAIRLLRGVVP